MAKKWRATGYGTFLCLTCLLAGCASSGSYAWNWKQVEGSGVIVAWRATGIARLEARKEAMGQARRKMWDACMDERVNLSIPYWVEPDAPNAPRVVSLAYLTVTDPIFESALRALIGKLRPTETRELPNGDFVVTMRLDRDNILDLVMRVKLRMLSTEG